MSKATEHATIAARVNEAIVAGRLPRSQPTKTWVGHGSGKLCDGCGAEIAFSTLEHEYDFDGAPVARLHADCAKIWTAMVNYSEARSRSSSQST